MSAIINDLYIESLTRPGRRLKWPVVFSIEERNVLAWNRAAICFLTSFLRCLAALLLVCFNHVFILTEIQFFSLSGY